MGNYKFRFSDMIPNAWFFKLKDMSKPKPRSNYSKTSIPTNKMKKKPTSSSEFTKPHVSDQRKSYYFTRDLTTSFQPQSPTKSTLPDKTSVADPPRKSSRRRRSTKRNRPRLVSASTISARCSCHATVWDNKPNDDDDDDDSSPSHEECTNSNSGRDQSSSSDPDSVLTEYGSDKGRSPDTTMGSWSGSPCKCGTKNDIVIDINNDGDHQRRLPPIITKKNEPTTKIQRTSAEFSETSAYGSLSVKVVKEDFVTSATTAAAASPVRRFPAKTMSSPSPGMKLRVNSPRIANYRRVQGRRSASSNSSSAVSDSFAVVKASKDPRRDFKESMVEMIVENNMTSSKDLEELLACYLSLNCDEYHDLIINVFKQIWFEFNHLRLK